MKSRLFNIRLSFEITENKSEDFFLLKNDLISLLDAIQRTGSIKAAAEELGYSFRHIWNELNKWEEELGQSLVNRSRGKNAELSPLAEQLLWTNKEVEAKYKEQIIELQSGISYSFRKAFNSAWDPIVIEGCADSALNLLRRTTDCEIELNFTTSRKGLEALREGKCELAGFNFPKSSTNNSKAFGTFGHLLTKNNGLIFFATRLQGLAVAPGNPKKIYSILDIASRKAKFINRREGTGTRILFDQMLDVLAVKPEEIEGYNDISDTQFFTAVQIASGKVDVGLCTANVAKENGLDFIPLAKEVYYLAADEKFLETAKAKKFIQFLRSYDWAEFKDLLEGYDFTGTGEVFKVSDVFTADAS